MANKNNERNEKINVELGGMGLYGTTSDKEIAGYKATGDIENAGQIDKFEKIDKHKQARASFLDEDKQD
ncbi:hypothetical protein QR721_01355 [Aciduricibacillus chroicocephali]|uniref:DUF4025 domain-containing protein n=1 Tax=Aciduricibacillus chroicocephali TaxID=3054939 RepID=A0ABY9KVK8_9BACI|nr:hypothetical protein QR721_01355 [Bacillaceae bacterium 44XB]